MGKKRRLNSAKAKFNTKHANHPRARYLNRKEEVVEEVVMPLAPPELEVVMAPAEPEPEVVLVVPSPKPEVALQEKVVKKAPKVAPKRKRTKKAPAKRRRAKKTATQDVTT